MAETLADNERMLNGLIKTLLVLYPCYGVFHSYH